MSFTQTYQTLCRNCRLRIAEYQRSLNYKTTFTYMTGMQLTKCTNCDRIRECAITKVEYQKEGK